MNHEAICRLLKQIEIIRHPSDLDLLLFFVRYRRALLTSEHLASMLGYGPERIGQSLDVLLAAGLLRRTQTQTATSRLYVMTPVGPDGGWLPALVELASTREGRLALIAALPERPSEASSEGRASGTHDRIALVR